MDDPGLSDGYRRASPWPLFVAFGFVLSEVGVFLDLFPVAVSGILLFGGSVAGILRESGYVSEPWGVLAALGVGLALVGATIVAWQADPAAVDLASLLSDPGGAVRRGLAIGVAGVMLLAAGGTGRVVGRTSV